MLLPIYIFFRVHRMRTWVLLGSAISSHIVINLCKGWRLNQRPLTSIPWFEQRSPTRWCRLRDSNSRPLPCKGNALPTELNLHISIIGWNRTNCVPRQYGIEPSRQLSYSPILVYYYTMYWCRRRDSNSHWLVPKTSASAIGLPRLM